MDEHQENIIKLKEFKEYLKNTAREWESYEYMKTYSVEYTLLIAIESYLQDND